MRIWFIAIIFTLAGVSITERLSAQCNCYKSDISGDEHINFIDFARLAANWLKSETTLNGDLDDSGTVDFKDLQIMCAYWLNDCGRYVQQLNVQACDSNSLGFSVTVQGSNLYFEDMVRANCCAEKVRLSVIVEGNKITIYEVEILGSNVCLCMCDYPTTAILGPFNAGSYTVEVLDIFGNSRGIVEVNIGS